MPNTSAASASVSIRSVTAKLGAFVVVFMAMTIEREMVVNSGNYRFGGYRRVMESIGSYQQLFGG